MSERTKSPVGFWLVIGLLMLPALYVASFFIAAWLLDPIHSKPLEKAFSIFYFPLLWLVEKIIFS